MIPHSLAIPDLYDGAARIVSASFPRGRLFPAPVSEAHVARVIVEWPSGHVSGYLWSATGWRLEERIYGYSLSNSRVLFERGPGFRDCGRLSYTDAAVITRPLSTPDWRPLEAWLRAAHPEIGPAVALQARVLARWLARFGNDRRLEDGQSVRGLAYGSELADDASACGALLGPCDVDRLIVGLHMLGVISPSHFAPTGREIVITSTEADMMRASRVVASGPFGTEGPDGRMFANWGNAAWYWGRGSAWAKLPAFGP